MTLLVLMAIAATTLVPGYLLRRLRARRRRVPPTVLDAGSLVRNAYRSGR